MLNIGSMELAAVLQLQHDVSLMTSLELAITLVT